MNTKTEILSGIRDLFSQGYGGLFLARHLTKKVDDLIKGIFASASPAAPLVCIATGGYGRAELSPYSDIDIMMFAPDRDRTAEAEAFLHKLWDTGFNIAHSFRTPRECLYEARKDLRTRTAMLEARYVTGDSEIYRMFRQDVYSVIARKDRKEFVRDTLRETARRHNELGNSVFLLEPHIKEGEGGLRDFHAACWLSKIALKIGSPEELSHVVAPYDFKRLMSAYDFLLRTRAWLHFQSGRRNDVLTFEYQKSAAAGLGFRDSRKFSGPERFMRYYHLKGKAIREVSQKIISDCSRQYIQARKSFRAVKLTDDFLVSGGKIIAARENVFSDPDKILEAFSLFAKTGREFSDSLKEKLGASLVKIKRMTGRSRLSIRYFLGIFSGSRVSETLYEMHYTGILGRFVPEFGALRLLVVHEPYHMYTVDEHSLLAVKNLELLRTTTYKNLEELREICYETRHFDMVLLALLFHDIGKATGKHHEEEGYLRIKRITERLSLDRDKKARIEFLVKNHVLMSRVAMKRETSDPEVIAMFADAVGDMENLKAIYLMTYADMTAVRPGFLSSWKAHFLKDLFRRTKEYLEGIKEEKAGLLREIGEHAPEFDMKVLGDFIAGMPERYVRVETRDRIIADYRLFTEAQEKGYAIRSYTSHGGTGEVVVSGRDFPGLFSKIVGCISSKGLNIVSGRIYTGKNGFVIDKILISNWKELWWEGLEDEIRSELGNVLAGRILTRVFARGTEAESLFESFIEIDNETGDEYSVIELFAPDRLGLLFDVSNALFELDVNIISARIHTEGGLAEDVFYVDSKGGRIGYDQIGRILSELWQVLKG